MLDDEEGFKQNKGLKSNAGSEDKSNFSYFLIETSILKSRLDLHSSLFSCNQTRNRSPSITKFRLGCCVIFFPLFLLLTESSSFINLYLWGTFDPFGILWYLRALWSTLLPKLGSLCQKELQLLGRYFVHLAVMNGLDAYHPPIPRFPGGGIEIKSPRDHPQTCCLWMSLQEGWYFSHCFIRQDPHHCPCL